MKGLLRKSEVLIALLLLAIFLIWSASKCGEAPATDGTEGVALADSLAQVSQPLASNDGADAGLLSDELRKKIAERATADSIAKAAKLDSLGAKSTASAKPVEPTYNYLWVTIDKLKIRGEPGLKGELLGELKLFDKVYFLEEMTDTTYQINLGYEVADEPYVKVKTRRGTVGWVYGAGVHYHKKKREGVME